jgi:paraquat-inducible protein B
MGRQANPTLIGSFVLVALALAVVVALVLGGGKFFQQPRYFVAVFEGSLRGLSVGAPVTFRGVRIGQVSDIAPVVVLHEGQVSLDVVVTLEVRRGQFRGLDGSPIEFRGLSDREFAERLSAAGVRAQLAMQSFLTGQLYVDLDFYPGSPLTLSAVETRYPQIGAIQTGLRRLGKTIETLPIDQLAAKALDTLQGIDRTVNSPRIGEILDALQQSVASLERLTAKLDAEVGPLVASVRGAADSTAAAMDQVRQTLAFESGVPGKMASSFIGTMDQARQTLNLKDGPVAPALAGLTRAAESADQALREAKGAFAGADEMLDPRSDTRRRLQTLLEELAAASRSLRVLADYLERHPEALIQGKRW